MTDEALAQAIDALRHESEADAADVAEQSSEAINRAGQESAQEILKWGDLLTISQVDAVIKVFTDRIDKDVIGFVDELLRNSLAKEAANFAKAIGEKMRAEQLADLARAIEFNSRWLPTLPAPIEGWVNDQMRGAVTGPLRAIEVVDNIRGKMNGQLAQYANTQVFTTLQTMDQITILEMTRDLDADLFLYTGPDDIVARPFCHELVWNIYPRSAIDKSDNGQIPGVMVSRGGFNCRHRWRPVTLRTAEFLKRPIIQPYRMETETVSGSKKGTERTITYPVLA